MKPLPSLQGRQTKIVHTDFVRGKHWQYSPPRIGALGSEVVCLHLNLDPICLGRNLNPRFFNGPRVIGLNLLPRIKLIGRLPPSGQMKPDRAFIFPLGADIPTPARIGLNDVL